MREHGLAIAAQSSTLAPADGKMYALRDVTATVDSIPLIAASIMSKKLAIGPSHLLLDVKVGAGAFMKTRGDGAQLAETMVRIGEDAGVRTRGRAHGDGSAARLRGGQRAGDRRGDRAAARRRARTTRRRSACTRWRRCCTWRAGGGRGRGRAARAAVRMDDGSGLAKFAEVVKAQGGDPAQIEDPDACRRRRTARW